MTYYSTDLGTPVEWESYFYERDLLGNITAISIRYFKIYISFIEPSLVIPKVVINGNGLYITCYLSKKDVNKIKKMGYEIKEI